MEGKNFSNSGASILNYLIPNKNINLFFKSSPIIIANLCFYCLLNNYFCPNSESFYIWIVKLYTQPHNKRFIA